MAIEKVKRAWFLVERGTLGALIQRLADSRTVHVVDLQETPDDAAPPETNAAAPHTPAFVAAADFTPELDLADDNVNKLTRSLDVLDGFVLPKRPFHENFVNLPAEMTQAEFEERVAAIDVAELYEQTSHIQRDHSAAQKRSAELSARIKQLGHWAGAPTPPAGLSRHEADLGTVPAKALPQLEAAGSDTIAIEAAAVKGNRALVGAVWLSEVEEEARELLESVGFESLEIEPGSGTVAAVIQKCDTALVTVEAKLALLEKQAAKLAAGRRSVVAALAHWQAEVERHTASAKTLASKRIATLSGYVLVRELPKLDALLAADFPSVSLVTEDPKPDEDVPVSLGGSKFFAPAQFLTSMFGLPDYFAFDPSPFILIMFLVFFGLCFGDVVYGVGLASLGLWLARKAGDNRSLAQFFELLALGGLFSIAVGVLTGSWAGNLLSDQYLGKGNVLGAVQKLSIFDPLDDPVAALVIALGVGVLIQFYAMGLLMYREWRKGNVFGALCDGGLWLVFLPGLILLLLGAGADLPPAITTAALWMIGLSGAGLVLTQGRHEETFFAKALTGLVSLYGIVGTYGTTAFIGDTLSYSRLLALGLTTVVVAQSSNMIAWMFGTESVLSITAVVLALVFFHFGNFLISILSAFVHSLRLVFVEFFTKFYEGGARPFVALGEPQDVKIIGND